ncbi:MAG TPA: ABC transporter permease [Longimicrobiales bacterium]
MTDAAPLIRVQPTRGWTGMQLGELWRYRTLLYFLAWRDVKVRYKQTMLGIGWAIVQPLLNTIIFTIVFGRFIGVRTPGNVAYEVFAFSGMLMWAFFSNALLTASSSVVNNANLISKVYFPRLIVPISGVAGALPDFAIGFLLLLIVMPFYGLVPGPAIFLVPAFLTLAVITALGVGIWLAALTARYRDFRYLVPFLERFWFFASPVAYASMEITQPWRTLYGLNPMVGVIEGFRWGVLRERPPSAMMLLSAGVAVMMLISGIYYFRRVEKTFADLI